MLTDEKKPHGIGLCDYVNNTTYFPLRSMIMSQTFMRQQYISYTITMLHILF